MKTYKVPHACRNGVALVTISRNLVAAEWLNDIMVSGAIASKKKAFIHGSPLVRRKKGLGEGKSPRADVSVAARHILRRLAQIVVNCNAGSTCVSFADQTPPVGEKRSNSILPP